MFSRRRQRPCACLGHVLKDHPGKVLCLAYSPDGTRLAGGGWGKAAILWDMAFGKQPLSLEADETGVLGVAFSTDGKRLATAGWDGIVKIWDVATGKDQVTIREEHGVFHSVAFSPDGKRVAGSLTNLPLSDRPADVKVWDAVNGKEILAFHGSA